MEPIRSLEDPFDEPESEEDPNQTRLIVLRIAVIVVLLILVGQLYRLQIAGGRDFRAQADNNRFRLTRIEAPRGIMYDRHHQLLVRNSASYTVGVTPIDLPTGSQRQVVLERLAHIVNLPVDRVVQTLQKSQGDPFTLVPIRQNVDQQTAFLVEEQHLALPGVHVALEPIRDYIYGPMTADILGYVGRISAAEYARLKDDIVHHYSINDSVGQIGLEATMEAALRGTPGSRQTEVDATGREVRVLGQTTPVPGHNLVLTIDLALQKRIAEILNERITQYHTATVVALDPNNGQVLAMVHLPSYDDNWFARGITDQQYNQLLHDPGHPLVNAAIGAAYPPGSAFELVTAAAGLQEKIITPMTQIDCNGSISVPNRFDPTVATRLPDWAAFGPQDVVSALADSCSVFFYQVGGGEPEGKWPGLGIDGLGRYARLFGLDSPTGIDLVGEIGGFVPSVRWKRQVFNQEWVPEDTYLTAVGEGYLTATPLQMANLVAAVANGGTLYRPQLVLSEMDAHGTTVKGFKPEVIRQVAIDPSYLAAVRQGMIDSLGTGTTATGTKFTGNGRTAAVKGMTAAGKTGQVEFGVPDANGKLATHGWFLAFAPADHPTIALAVFLDYGSGAGDAAAVAHQILDYYRTTAKAAAAPTSSCAGPSCTAAEAR